MRGTTPVGLPHAQVCWAYIIHADVLREWNRLDEALALALQGVQLSEQTETIVALYLAYSVLMHSLSGTRKDGRSTPGLPKVRSDPGEKLQSVPA